VCGEVVATIAKLKSCEKIVVSFLGRANVCWVEEEYFYYFKRIRTYRNQVTYVRDQAVLWSKEASCELTIGEHHFPFRFQLPQRCPPSFEGSVGSIKYALEAQVTSKERFQPCNASLYVKVKAGPGILRLYRQPDTAETVKSVGPCCVNLGSITCSVTLPRTGFSNGQTIPISASINNQTSRVLKIKAAIYRKDTFHSSGQRVVDKTKVTKILGPRIQPMQAASFDDITIDIPHDIYPTIKSCSCISVEYILAVKIVIPWSFNRTVKMPIVISGEYPETAQEDINSHTITT
jgi:hypothetical protein